MNPPAPSPESVPLPSPDGNHASCATRRTWVLIGLAVLVSLVALLRLCVGETFGFPTGEYADLMLQLRQMRLLCALAVGAALAVSGTSLQALLRNPLAEPYLLGLSSGAAVGVMVQMLVSYHLGQHLGAMHLGALAGALLSMSIVFAAGRRRGSIDPLGLLLVGVVLSTINGAVVMLLNYLAGPGGLRDDVMRWMMGYLNEALEPSTVYISIALIAGGVLVLLSQARAMDVATFSDAEALSLGVNLTRLRALLFMLSGLLAATAVVLAGPVAFVGLICPHLARLLLGPSHRALLIGSALLGMTLITLADTAVVALDVGQGRLPLGIFTATLGGITFLAMLRPQLGRGLE